MNNSRYTLIQGDAFEQINQLDDNSVKLLITSPPYNIGKIYEKRVQLEEYLSPYNAFAKNVYDKITPDGSVCWQVGNYVQDGEVYPLDVFFYQMFKDAGFKLRNRIIWHFEHGLHATMRFSGRYETILWFTKTDTYTFNLDAVRVPAKYPGKTHYKGEKRGQPSGNPLGKNPADFWKIVASDWEHLVWSIPNVKANHPEKTSHPCQFPIELVQRCVVALTNEGETVLDPFLGVGSAVIAALMHNRHGLGIEISPEYLETARQRIADYRGGRLKIRPLGKPVYTPTGREKVSQIPLAWQKPAPIDL